MLNTITFGSEFELNQSLCLGNTSSRKCSSLNTPIYSISSTGKSWNNVRLVHHSPTNPGRLEIYYKNEWGTVCDDNFTLAEGNVICRQLGYQRAVEYNHSYSSPGEGYGPVMRSIDCKGNETNWIECDFKELGTTTCTHRDYVAVGCTHYPDGEYIILMPLI